MGTAARLGIICFLSMGFISTRNAHAEFTVEPEWSTARIWVEAMLANNRKDLFRPTVSARNCYHLSAAMWDSWAAYDVAAAQVKHHERQNATDVEEARREAISYAAYRLLSHRFAKSLNPTILDDLDGIMDTLGYDKTIASTLGNHPAALGNRVAATYIYSGQYDGSNERNNYKANNGYLPINLPLAVSNPTLLAMDDPNRWQPLSLSVYVDKTGVVLGGYPSFTTPHWGRLPSFSMPASVKSGDYLYYDPGDPPYLGGEGDDEYKAAVVEMVERSSRLDPDNGVMIDISPASMGNNPLGTHEDPGYAVNPVTGETYTPQIVPEADYARAITEYWFQGIRLSGPDTYWYVLINSLSERPEFEKRIGGTGPVVNDLEWDVKAYLAIGGAAHDAAIAVWGVKYWYDYARPVSMVRHMSLLGQSSDENLPGYNPQGMPLVPGLIELITEESSAPGERHEHLAAYPGLIAVRAWAGFPEDPETDVAGVAWKLGIEWVPYHPGNFVTPSFAGYVSGHSTFCRTGAEVLTALTGSPWFPGGLEEYVIPQDEYLTFEKGPSVGIVLQWASYYDVADAAGISRRWGGVHVPADDLPGRIMGSKIGKGAWEKVQTYFDGRAQYHAADQNRDGVISLSELLRVLQLYNVGEYCYLPGTEDNFTPGLGQRESCLTHTADNSPQDWRIDHSELLRMVQLYNAAGYILCPGEETEDGFCVFSS